MPSPGLSPLVLAGVDTASLDCIDKTSSEPDANEQGGSPPLDRRAKRRKEPEAIPFTYDSVWRARKQVSSFQRAKSSATAHIEWLTNYCKVQCGIWYQREGKGV